jgi:hypothetical protein
MKINFGVGDKVLIVRDETVEVYYKIKCKVCPITGLESPEGE